MALFVSCRACAFQQVVEDVQEFESLKRRHEANHGDGHEVRVIGDSVD